MDRNLAQPITAWPLSTWNLQQLSLAALYFNPAMDTARARLAEADAATITAGARPNPTLDLAPGIPSPYLLSLDLTLPLETAGKRGHRIQSARDLDQAAKFDLASAAWKVRSGVREALLKYVVTSRNLELLHREENLRSAQTDILQKRLAAGEIARPELAAAQTSLSETRLEIVAAEGDLTQSRVALAAAIGVPAAAINDLAFSWSSFDAPDSSLSPKEIQQDAVLNRLDVQSALAQYAAAEANLQLEIAKQYPDIQIGPGYTYEERDNFFTLGLSATLPLFNRNQGPIAEAEAKRKEAAAAFLEKQSQVVAESEQAFAAYNSSLHQLMENRQSLRRDVQNARLRTTQRAQQLGEEDTLGVNEARLESNALDRSELDALAQVQAALGRLEDAVQRPLDPSDGFPIAASLVKAPRESTR
jgi:outer membrane protein TolC